MNACVRACSLVIFHKFSSTTLHEFRVCCASVRLHLLSLLLLLFKVIVLEGVVLKLRKKKFKLMEVCPVKERVARNV